MKTLIYVVPGILTDVHLSGFNALENKSDYIFDVKVHDIYGKINKESDIKSIISFFEKTLDKFSNSYTSICLIGYSSGSEVILRSKLNKSVKYLILWSPSIFYPQSVAKSLKNSETDNDILILNSSTKLGKILAEDLDRLNTLPLIKNISLPYQVYLSKEDAGHDVWANYVSIPFSHNYTVKQIQDMLNRSKEHLKNNLKIFSKFGL